MPGGPARWAFHTPARLGATVGALLLAVAGAALVLPDGAATAPPDGAATAPPDRPAAGSGPDGVPGDTGPPRTGSSAVPRGAAATAERFLRTWLAARVTARATWHDRIAAVATPDLAAGLRLTDPAGVPDADLERPLEPLVGGDYAVEFRAALSDGSAVVVQVVYGGDRWRASDIRPESPP